MFRVVIAVFDIFATIGSPNKMADLPLGVGFIEALWWVSGV